LDLPTEKVGDRRHIAAIGHMNHVDAPVIILNNSPATWFVVPVPDDAMLILPGLALA
jgi:hypothetical protein